MTTPNPALYARGTNSVRTGVEACHGNNFSQKLVFPHGYCNPDSNFAMPKSPRLGFAFGLWRTKLGGYYNAEFRSSAVGRKGHLLSRLDRADLRGFGTL